jgi:hypothetical protein
VVSFTLRPLYPRGKNPDNYWIGGSAGPRVGLDYMEKRKFLTVPGLELRPLGLHPVARIYIYIYIY